MNMVYGSSRQSISSLLTFFYKIIFPTLWIGGFGLGTLGVLISGSSNAGGFFIGLLIGSLFFYWFCFPLKSVQLDEHYLYVSNFRKTIQIPFSYIEEVTECPLINIHPVWIKFKIPTEFGTKIIFMPYFHFGSLFMMSHPVVAKLRELAGTT
jgi:hypothetical protein